MPWLSTLRSSVKFALASFLCGTLVGSCLAAQDEEGATSVGGGGLRDKIRERMQGMKSGGKSGETSATQPTQPKSGPGGAEYAHGSVTHSIFGEGNDEFTLFEPADPRPEVAPVIIFLHGWSAMKPEPYQDWINHLVRRGNIVIYPRYQAKISTKPGEFTPSAIKAVKSALVVLDQSDHVHPDREKVAVVGHSMGGILTANLAASGGEGLPPIKAAMCVEPGSGGFPITADYSKIPAGTLLLCIAGDQDKLVKETKAKDIFSGATSVAKADKNYILAISDAHGSPPVTANHMAPTDLGGQDALHYFGYWKWCDALTDAAFYGKNRNVALGNTAEQRFMGKWSDGVPVAEPKIEEGN